jgi:hypothetical protein
MSFCINGQPFGAGVMESEFVHGQLRVPRGYVYVCPVCAKAWAKVEVEGQLYVIYSKTCEEHETPFYFDFPGSIWLDWDKPYQMSFSKEVLLREVLIHARHWESFNGRV